MVHEEFLFRGTTEGWLGSEGSQAAGRICTSTDPLVATIFALECIRKGKAILLIANRERLRHLEVQVPNWFGDLECEVVLDLMPGEFGQFVDCTVPADTARDILIEMGFEMPHVIRGQIRLDDELEDSLSRGYRLSVTQIREFIFRCGGSHG